MLIVKIMDFIGKSLVAAFVIVVGVALVVGLVLLVVNGWADYSLQITVLALAASVLVAGERVAGAIRGREDRR
ncbi:hypothetical protein ACXYTP_00520 [Tsukamurella ocularis]|uniref:hypothetical protein n=1 Tax=Tsukamurella ocularis TaxID=1970234 RepID=UPI0039EF4E53